MIIYSRMVHLEVCTDLLTNERNEEVIGSSSLVSCVEALDVKVRTDVFLDIVGEDRQVLEPVMLFLYVLNHVHTSVGLHVFCEMCEREDLVIHVMTSIVHNHITHSHVGHDPFQIAQIGLIGKVGSDARFLRDAGRVQIHAVDVGAQEIIPPATKTVPGFVTEPHHTGHLSMLHHTDADFQYILDVEASLFKERRVPRNIIVAS